MSVVAGRNAYTTHMASQARAWDLLGQYEHGRRVVELATDFEMSPFSVYQALRRAREWRAAGGARPAAERLVVQARPTVLGECVLWSGYLNRQGYGQIAAPRSYVGTRVAHRVAYQQGHGVVLTSEEKLDHLCHGADPTCLGGRTCRHRACINLGHLVVATPAENQARSTRALREVCPAGHSYTAANTIIRRAVGLQRVCRQCKNEWERANRQLRELSAASH